MAKLKILYLALEFDQWRRASHLSYSIQLGFEEALRDNGVDCFTITSPWLGEVKNLCKGKKFDQVWVEIVHNELSDDLLQWIEEIAPIRLGLLAESLEYSEDECQLSDVFKTRKQKVKNRFKHFTHIASCDERDVELINKEGLVTAMWWPPVVAAKRIINNSIKSRNKSVFIGTVYGRREQFFANDNVRKMLLHIKMPDGRIYPFLFNRIHRFIDYWLKKDWPFKSFIFLLYMTALRHIRRVCFIKWLKALGIGSSVVNLPHVYKGYPGRVLDAMLIGRPVISWRIPDRPLNEALFKENKEILFFDNDDATRLAAQINALNKNADLAEHIKDRARAKVLEFHTVERRVREILRWLEVGKVPVYD